MRKKHCSLKACAYTVPCCTKKSKNLVHALYNWYMLSQAWHLYTCCFKPRLDFYTVHAVWAQGLTAIHTHAVCSPRLDFHMFFVAQGLSCPLYPASTSGALSSGLVGQGLTCTGLSNHIAINVLPCLICVLISNHANMANKCSSSIIINHVYINKQSLGMSRCDCKLVLVD